MIYVSRKTKRQQMAKLNPLKRFFVLWRDNLTDWLWYVEEHRLDSRLDIQRFVKKAVSVLKQNSQSMKRDFRHQLSSNEKNRFPESDNWFIRLFLFLGGSIPRIGDHFKERAYIRRKREIQFERMVRTRVEQLRLHPLQFIAYGVAILSVAGLLSLYTVANEVTFNGVDVGTVSMVVSPRRILSKLENESRSALGDESYTIDRHLLKSEATIVPRKLTISREDFSDSLSEAVGDVSYAYVLYVDGEPLAATKYEGALEELLEQLKEGYITEDTIDCYFEESIEITEEYINSDYVMNLGYIAEILNATKAGEITYTVEKNDTYYSVAAQYDMTLDDLLALNPGYNPSLLKVGDVLTISNAVPYLTVVHTERKNYLTDVPYSVEYEYDDTMYQGDYSVISSGVFGKADLCANVTFINGTETTREIISNVVLQEPVVEIQKTGTITRPSWFPTGSFRWPCYGTITSRFGGRNTGISGASTNHAGIDIANSYGTPIYASDGGTVTYAGWMSGYGYLVIIDHANGYKTYYGHCSSMLVYVGQHVYKGEQIARVGSTGISSGNHCHFGIELNGTFVDPLNYL